MRRTVRNTLISMLAVLAAAALLYGALLAVRAMSGADSLRLPGSGTTPHQNVEQLMRTIAADDPEAVYAIGVIVPRDVSPVTATEARAFFEALIATSPEPDASSRTFIPLGESVQPALFLTASFVPLEVLADGALLFGER